MIQRRPGRASRLPDVSMFPVLKTAACLGIGLVAACAKPLDSGGLTAPQFLTRASLDLRGRLPSEAELAAVTAQPAQVDAMVSAFVDDDAFGLRVRDLFAGTYRTRSARYFFSEPEDDEEVLIFERMAGEEILKLIEHIAIEDRPFTELVTGDYTFADETMAKFWPLEGYDDEVGGWQMVSYGDGRPAAGIISTNSFHMRYLNMDENYNRGRANALSRILLCDNYLARPIDFPRDIDLTDANAIENAISENAACVSCHASLDPFASFLFGYPGEDDDYLYDEERAWLWEETTGQAPAYYGTAGDDAADLGAAIAQDARFAKCTTRRVFEGLVGRKALDEDADALRRHQDAFVSSGMRLKPLIESILRDPVYQGRSDSGRVTVGSKLMSPETLDLTILDLTGYQLLQNDASLLRSDRGLHVLGGGLSHHAGDYAPSTSNVTRVLVQSQVAEGAAIYLLEEQSGFYDRVFQGVDMDTPDRDAIARLYTQILGKSVDGDDAEVVELVDLWDALVEADLDEEAAWAGVVSVLLRDPRFLHY